MTVIQLVVNLVILGLVFYCIELIPMSSPFPQIVKVVAVLGAVLLVLQFLGIATGFTLR